MKNITLSADENLIKKAREKAKKEKTSLNQRFREWLEKYVHQTSKDNDLEEFLKKLMYADSGGSFSRDELNER